MQLALFDTVLNPNIEAKVLHVDEEKLTKIYYTITEVAELFNVNASLLRFWEKEFPAQLAQVKKNKKGDRYYNKKNITAIKLLVYLTKEKKLTLAGAREFLKNSRKNKTSDADIIEHLETVKTFLVQLKTNIKKHENN
jgi:DNA-binding transcriptional MerR regulator